MQHPFLKNRNFIPYITTWVMIAAVFGFALYNFYGLTWQTALIDSLVFNALFMGLGLAYWFNVRYSTFDKSQLINQVISHLAAAAISILVGVFLFKMIVTPMVQEEYYETFVKDSMPLRGALGVLYYAIVVLIYYLILYYDDLNTKSQRQAQLETMLKSSELEMLKSQINPHFIFNSLNSISSLTMIAPDRAREMVVKLSDFLRYSLGKENDQMNSVEDEINNIMLYLDIERVRFGDRLKVEKEVAEDVKNHKLPNLILQPLFENAIKHGIYESLEEITIQLKAWKEANLLKIQVSNEYDPNAVSRKGKGIGLKNVRERLSLIYGVSQLVEVSKTDGIFTIRLDIPQTIADS
ncbi:MAG: histidine kinase [Roseivirga sp.]|jgi:sensor histidine kinase YesM|uniref:sensor histidine kinase n=1 Tax=Roseivirga sp. TaxID=1964215 RepID=UPI001B14D43D|nr:histidine kinase [Roseivirga sp.]MBO6494095.1 histidine kinase [Roseivirga sp.]